MFSGGYRKKSGERSKLNVRQNYDLSTFFGRMCFFLNISYCSFLQNLHFCEFDFLMDNILKWSDTP